MGWGVHTPTAAFTLETQTCTFCTFCISCIPAPRKMQRRRKCKRCKKCKFGFWVALGVTGLTCSNRLGEYAHGKRPFPPQEHKLALSAPFAPPAFLHLERCKETRSAKDTRSASLCSRCHRLRQVLRRSSESASTTTNAQSLTVHPCACTSAAPLQ